MPVSAGVWSFVPVSSAPMSKLASALLVVGFSYSMYASIRAYPESGETWMLFLPQWIDKNSGVSAPTSRHGMAAFAILLVGLVLFMQAAA